MEVQMEELIQAVEALSRKTAIDYLIVIVPILVSIVAVLISIGIAKRQNKIALTEKRLAILRDVKLILCFAESIDFFQKDTDENRNDMIEIYSGIFGMDFSSKEATKISFQEIYRSVNAIERTTIMIEFFFDLKTDKQVSRIVGKMLNLLSLIVDQDSTFIAQKNDFCEACTVFKKEMIPQMQKITRI